mgnify:CR=1 FL=1
MGTLDRIRKTSPYVLALFAIIFVAFMVLSDIGDNSLRPGRNDPRTEPVVTINDQDIVYAIFENEVESRISDERKSAEQQGREPSEIDEKTIRQQIWAEILNNVIVAQQCDKAGITVTQNEILDQLIENPSPVAKSVFSDSAGFNLQLYQKLGQRIIDDPNGFLNEEIGRRKQANPNYSDEEARQFAEQIYLIRKYLMDYERKLPDQQLKASLQTLVNSASSVISPLFAKRMYLADNSSAQLDMFFFDANKILDTLVNVSDQELREYYDKNKKYYIQKPTRKVRYITLPIAASHEDSVKINKKMNSIQKELNEVADAVAKDSLFSKILDRESGVSVDFTSSKDMDKKLEPYLINLKARDVAGPIALPDGYYFLRLESIKDSADNQMVSASHILLKFAPDKSKDSLLKETKKILAMARKPGANFAELAMKYSEDGSAQSGGDLGTFGRGQMVKPFEDACFNNDSGKIVGPVETEYGYHIIKVNGKKTEKSYKYSYVKLQPTVSDETAKQIRNIGLQIKRAVDEGGDFNKIALEKNLVPQESPFFEKSQPAINSMYISALAFESDKGEVLDPTLTMSGDEKLYYVVQVTEERKAGTVPFEDMIETLKEKVRHQKKIKQLLQEAKTFKGKIASYTTLESAKAIDSSMFKTFADLKDNGTVPGIGQDYFLTTMAFKEQLNKISEPFAGDKGVYIIQVKSRNIPSDKKQIEQGIKDRIKTLKEGSRNSAFYNWFRQITDDSKIVDYRISKWRMRF